MLSKSTEIAHGTQPNALLCIRRIFIAHSRLQKEKRRTIQPCSQLRSELRHETFSDLLPTFLSLQLWTEHRKLRQAAEQWERVCLHHAIRQQRKADISAEWFMSDTCRLQLCLLGSSSKLHFPVSYASVSFMQAQFLVPGTPSHLEDMCTQYRTPSFRLPPSLAPPTLSSSS